jgi:hypothetical protein
VATKTNSRSVQRQIDLTTAVCQERLLATHVRHALAMVDLVSDSLPFDDALDIYVRILRLNSEQARNVGSRALAELGRRSGLPAEELDMPISSGAGEDVVSASETEHAEMDRDVDRADGRPDGRADAVFSRLRKRLQGRVQADLRQRINLAAARTEDELVLTHVDNALLFVKALHEEMPPEDSVDLYLDTMILPEGLGDVVYNRALRLFADDILPAIPQVGAARSSGPRAVRDPDAQASSTSGVQA